MSFFEFPHTRTYDSDLGFIIKWIAKYQPNIEDLDAWRAEHEEEYKDLYDKVEGLINNLVDVIVPWDSSIAYHIFSIVEYQGTNYIAIQDVPVGAMITDTSYWVPANTVTQQINAIGVVTSDTKENSVRRFETVANMAAALDIVDGNLIRTEGYYSVNDGGAAFYRVDSVAGANPDTVALQDGLYAHLVLDDPDSICVDQLGAYGDGTTDDAAIINYALTTYNKTVLNTNKNYYIASTLHIPYGHSFIGNNTTITAAAFSSFADLSVTGLPQKVAIMVEGREPIANSEQEGYTKKVQGFKLFEDGTQSDGTGTSGFVGIYAGYKTALAGSGSKVNYSVYSYIFEDILIYGFDSGFYIAEVWQSKFNAVDVRNFKTAGFNMLGQSVNNYFFGCTADGRTGAAGTRGLHLNVSPNYDNRPEGNMFASCGFFSCEQNIVQNSALATELSSCMSDLASKSALTCVLGDIMVSTSWLGSRNGANSLSDAFSSPTVYLYSVAVADSGNKATITNCHILNANENSGATPYAVAQGSLRYSDIVSNCLCAGSVRQTNSNAAFFIYNNAFENANDTIYTLGNGVRSGNYQSIDGSPMT